MQMGRPTARAGYCFRVRGHLPPDWQDFFDGFTLEQTADGCTRLISPPIDQAAMHGALMIIRDLGLYLEAICPAQ